MSVLKDKISSLPTIQADLKETKSSITMVRALDLSKSSSTSSASPSTIVVASPTGYFPRRLELPVFSGEDPIGWLARAEQYFELQQTPAEKKVPMALVGMDGSALHWIRWLRQTTPDMSWETLKTALIKRYDGLHAGNEFERLCSVQHTSSVDTYINEYIELATHVSGLTD